MISFLRSCFFFGTVLRVLFGRPCSEDYPYSDCTVCTKWKTVTPGDVFCDDLPNTAGSNFEKLNCLQTAVDEKICLEERILNKTKLACTRTHRPKEKETCESVARKYNIHLRRLRELNRKDACNFAPSTRELCVDGFFDCPKTVVPPPRLDCYAFAKKTGCEVAEIRLFNKGILCTDDAEMRPFPVCVVEPCINREIISKIGLTCENVAAIHETSNAQIRDSNPEFNCDALSIGDSPCPWRKGQWREERAPTCDATVEAGDGATCENLATRYSTSFNKFMDNNFLLNCNKLVPSSKICVGFGYFATSKCTDFIVNDQEENMCERLISDVFKGQGKELLEKLNPSLDCDAVRMGRLICLRNSESPQLIDAVRELKKYSAPLEKTYELYTKNKIELLEVLTTLMKEITVDYVADRFVNMISQNNDLSSVVNALTSHINRKQACDLFKKSYIFSYMAYVRECICGDEHLIFCSAHLFVETEKVRNEKIAHVSKDVPSLVDTVCKLSATQVDTDKGGCAIPGCKVDYKIFSIHLDNKLCRPPALPKNAPAICTDVRTCFLEKAIVAKFQLCSTESILRYSFGGEPCITVEGLYNPLLGVMRVNMVKFSSFYKIEVRMSFKVHNMVQDTICEAASFRCEDYCVWRKESIWKTYGLFKTSMDFGFFKIPLFEIMHTFPYEVCNANHAVVIFHNRRWNTNVTVRCWSSDHDNQYIMDAFTIRYNSKYRLAFKVNRETSVSCAMKDQKSTGITLDVYGGKYGPLGRRFHNYRIEWNKIEYYLEDDAKKTVIAALWD